MFVSQRRNPNLYPALVSASLALVCLTALFFIASRSQAQTPAQGIPNFDTQLAFDTSQNSAIHSVTSGDFGGGDTPDIVTADQNGQVKLYLDGNADSPITLLAGGSGPASVASGHINDGNKDDLVIARSNAQHIVYFDLENSLVPNITCPPSIKKDGQIQCIGLEVENPILSVNNVDPQSGNDEIIIGYVDSDKSKINMYTNNGFETTVADAEVSFPMKSLAIGASSRELFVAGSKKVNKCEMIDNDSTCEDVTVHNGGASISDIAVMENYGDCPALLVAVTGGQNIILYSDTNTAPCNYNENKPFGSETSTSKLIRSADITNDTVPEIITVDSGNAGDEIHVYQATVTSTATITDYSQTELLRPIDTKQINDLVIADMDKDAFSEMIVAGTGQISVLWGKPNSHHFGKKTSALHANLIGSAYDQQNQSTLFAVADMSGAIDVYSDTADTWYRTGFTQTDPPTGMIKSLAVTDRGSVAVAVEGGQSVLFLPDPAGQYPVAKNKNCVADDTEIDTNIHCISSPADSITQIAVATINNDKANDIVVGKGDGRAMIYLQKTLPTRIGLFSTNKDCVPAAPDTTIIDGDVLCLGTKTDPITSLKTGHFKANTLPDPVPGIIVAREDGEIEVFLRTKTIESNGTIKDTTDIITSTDAFATATFTITASGAVRDVAISDINSDGYNDIIALLVGGDIEFYLGDKQSLFVKGTKPLDFPPSFGVISVSAKDNFLLLGKANKTVSILKQTQPNTSTLAFQHTNIIVASVKPSAVFPFEHDTNPGSFDIVASGSNAALAIYRDALTVPLHPAITSFGKPVGSNSDIAAGDIDNNGSIDLVVANDGGQNLVYLNDGHGNYRQTLSFGTGKDQTIAVKLAYVNNDDLLDIIAVNRSGAGEVFFNSTDKTTRFMAHDCQNNQQGCFGSAVENFSLVSAANMNNDSAEDIVAYDTLTSELRLYTSIPNNSTFSAGIVITHTSAFVSGLATADIDNNKKPDIIFGNVHGEIYIYAYVANTFILSQTLNTGNSASLPVTVIALADDDRDGLLDLIVSQSDGTSCLYRHSSPSSGQPFENTCFPLPENKSFTIADVNSDGKADLIAVSKTGTEGFGSVYFTMAKQSPPISFGGNLAPCEQTNLDGSKIIAADVDGQHGIDLIGMNCNGKNRIFLNSGDGQLVASAPDNQSNDTVTKVLLGDLNGDQKLDILARTDKGITLYTNTTLEPTRTQQLWRQDFALPIWRLDALGIQDVAIGALGGSAPAAALDIFVATTSNLQVYRREAGGTYSMVATATLPLKNATGLAVGDLDGDGQLDAVVPRSSGGGLILFGQNDRNKPFLLASAGNNADCASSVAAQFTCFGPKSRSIRSATLADLNADGALDIIAALAPVVPSGEADAHDSSQSVVYFNDGAGTFSSGEDVTCANLEQYKYRCIGSESLAKRAFATADLDGNGAADVVVGIENGQTLIYLNDGNGNFSTASPNCNNEPPLIRCIGGGSDPTTAVATGDIDNNGASDVVLARPGAQSLAYLNNGFARFRDVSTPVRTFGGTEAQISALALGDMNSDGALDVVVGEPATGLYLNAANSFALQPNNPPQVVVRQPGAAPPADFYARPQIANTRSINIPFTLYDPEGDSVRAISVTYSLDGGANWLPAAPGPQPITGAAPGTNLSVSVKDGLLQTAALPTRCGILQNLRCPYTYQWDVVASHFYGQSNNVVVRMIIYPGAEKAGSVAGFYQRPAISAQSWPFRAQGIVIKLARPKPASFVMPPNPIFVPVAVRSKPLTGNLIATNDFPASLAGASVYCVGTTKDCNGQVLGKSATQPFHTNSEGVLMGRGTAPISGSLVALLPAHPNGKYAKNLGNRGTLYYRSVLTPISTTQSTIQTLFITDTNPLIVFDLSIAVEWDARNDKTFLSSLAEDLQRASNLLYDWTNGQVALGKLTINQNKEEWDQADIRIYASNRVRPNATHGGIIDKSDTSGKQDKPSFKRGRIQIGPVWSRWGDTADTRNRDWPNALAHELGHYLFSLEDNYLGYQNGVLVAADGCPGAMTDPYVEGGKNSEFVNWNVWSTYPACRKTLSPRPDWQTIVATYPWLNGDREDNGPAFVPIDILTLVPKTPKAGTPAPLAGEPSLDILNNGDLYTPRQRARAFLLRSGSSVSGTVIFNEIVDLGQPEHGQVRARGLRNYDRVCVYDPQPANSIDDKNIKPEMLRGCSPKIEPLSELPSIAMSSLGKWFPNVRATLPTSRTLNVQVLDVSIHPADVPVSPTLGIQIYPSSGASQYKLVDFNAQTGIYSTTFTVDPKEADTLLAGYIRVWEKTRPSFELVTDYALGGGPVSRGSIRGGEAPGVSADGQVIVYVRGDQSPEDLFVIQPATQWIELPPWATQIGSIYRLGYLKPAVNLGNRVSISFNYLGREVSSDSEEPGITIYFRPSSGNTQICRLKVYNGWCELATSVDKEHNIASAQAPGPGLYAIGSSYDEFIDTSSKGWGQFTYPMRDVRPVAQALAYIEGQYQVVVLTKGNTNTFYYPNDPVNSDFTELKPQDKVYGIRMLQPNAHIRLRLRGPLGSEAQNQAQSNLNSSELAFYGTVMPGLRFQPAAGMPVQAWVGTTLCGAGYTLRLGDTIAYRVLHDAQQRLSAVCGQPGNRVAFRIGAHDMSTTSQIRGPLPQAIPLFP